MPKKVPGRPRTNARSAAVPSAASLRAATAKADQFIADQLKAIYDAVVVEPIPDRLLQLLDRLDNDPEQ
jgi:Anti-sigma factor NepR